MRSLLADSITLGKKRPPNSHNLCAEKLAQHNVLYVALITIAMDSRTARRRTFPFHTARYHSTASVMAFLLRGAERRHPSLPSSSPI
jgi:hypothetical protein